MFGLFHWFFCMISHCLSLICIKIGQFHFFQHRLTTFTFMPSLHSYDGFNWEAVISRNNWANIRQFRALNLDAWIRALKEFLPDKTYDRRTCNMGGSKKSGNILPNIVGLFLCPFLKTFSSTLYCLLSVTECTQVEMFIWDLKSSVFNVFSHAHSCQVISPLTF